MLFKLLSSVLNVKGLSQEKTLLSTFSVKASLLKGMSEFREGEVSLVCRKNILIHSKGPGFCYLEDNRFK